jgi:hypothetical protein
VNLEFAAPRHVEKAILQFDEVADFVGSGAHGFTFWESEGWETRRSGWPPRIR